MKHTSGRLKLKKRMEDACKELSKIASEKTPANETTNTYVKVGIKLGITGQTVYNYIQGKGGNGYLIESIIEEFKKL